MRISFFLEMANAGSQVTDVGEMDDEKNTPERFEKAFKDVPRDVWQVFEDPNELYAAFDALKGA